MIIEPAIQQKYNTAHQLLVESKPQLAIDLLREIIQETPNFAAAQNDLGVLYWRGGNHAAALHHLEQAWRISQNPSARNNLAAALREVGNREEAISHLEQMRLEGVLEADGYALLAGCLFDTKAFPALPEILIEWAEKEPTNPNPRLRLLEIPALVTHILMNQLRENRKDLEELVSALSFSSSQRNRLGDPFITIGVPTRNRREPLYVMLSSLARQSYKNFEVLISDDSDQLGLESEVKSLFPDLQIRYVVGPKISLPANRAHILREAEGELVVMCDDDHYLLPDCLALLVDTMLQHPTAGIVSAVWPHPLENPKLIEFDAEKEKEEYRLDLQNVGAPENFWWKNACELFKSYCVGWPLLRSQLSGGGCLIYRRSAVSAVGGFPRDLSFVSFREDSDMSHRMYLNGYDLLVQTAAIAYHMRATAGGCRDEKEWAGKLVRDGVGFLERLKIWRREAEERELLARTGSVRMKLQTSDAEVLELFDQIFETRCPGIELGDGIEIRSLSDSSDEVGVIVVTKESEEPTAISQLSGGRAIAAITCDRELYERREADGNWFYLPKNGNGKISADWIESREMSQLSCKNIAEIESRQHTLRVLLREIERRLMFGVHKPKPVDESVVTELLEKNFSDKPKRPLQSFILEKKDRVIRLGDDFLPEQPEEIEELIKRLKDLPPFFFHYGGVGDALLLLSTFLDQRKSAIVLSAATSPKANEEFFLEFPEIEKLYLFELPNNGVRQTILRFSVAASSNCLGLGVAPLRSHKEEWVPGIDIQKSYRVNFNPKWINRFRVGNVRKQIAIAPKGSGLHMQGGKANTIPVELWPEIIQVVKDNGFIPVVVGTPDENEMYPLEEGMINKRSYNFGEQMREICSSAGLIGADSWAKTFSALAGIPTILFPPTYDGKFVNTEDASAYVFVKPWQNIHVCKSISELKKLILLVNATQVNTG